MKSHSPLQSIAAILCVLALVGVQILGAVRGYVCECGGQSFLTQATHCHDETGDSCPADASHEDHDRTDHTPVRADVAPRTSDASALVVAPAPLVIEWVEVFQLLQARESAPAVAHVDLDDSPPPPGVSVARTVVLLI